MWQIFVRLPLPSTFRLYYVFEDEENARILYNVVKGWIVMLFIDGWKHPETYHAEVQIVFCIEQKYSWNNG